MRGRQLRANIKKAKDFIGLWVKFHDLYKSAAKKEVITQEEEDLFLETKSLLTVKYKNLKESLGLNTSSDAEMNNVISHVLSSKSIAAMSDEVLDRIEKNWARSYTFLNSLLKSLEEQSLEFTGKRRFFEFIKRIFSKKIIQIIVLVLTIFFMMYMLNVIIRLLTG